MNALLNTVLAWCGALAVGMAAPCSAAAQPAPAKPDAPAAAPATGTEPKKDEKPGRVLTGRPTRVAVLNFGPPSDWQGIAENTVGAQINSQNWAEAFELLKKEDATNPIDVVVVRINSGGGAANEVAKFHRLFEQFKAKWRTVMWIESAISAAIMSPWVIPEIYVLPQGNFGGATVWFGGGTAVQGLDMELYHVEAENASRSAGRDPVIFRAMQVEDALSCDIDSQGNVTWYPNQSGKYLVKPEGRVLTINANDAIKYKLATAKAATLDELMKAMGYSEWELAGQRATKLIDDYLKEMTKAEKSFNAVYTKYQICVQGASQLPKEQRGGEVGRARGFLKQMRDWHAKNQYIGPEDGWFDEQEKILRDLLR